MRKKMGAFFLSFLFLLTVNCEKKIPFPTELVGMWTTKAPGYEDRLIDITDMQLIFGTGQVQPTILFVDKIKKNVQAQFIEWTFYCQNSEGSPIDIILFYKTGANGEQITLKNKEQVVWTKIQE